MYTVPSLAQPAKRFTRRSLGAHNKWSNQVNEDIFISTPKYIFYSTNVIFPLPFNDSIHSY